MWGSDLPRGNDEKATLNKGENHVEEDHLAYKLQALQKKCYKSSQTVARQTIQIRLRRLPLAAAAAL